MKTLRAWLPALLLPGACLVPTIGVAADSPPKRAAAPVVFSDAEGAHGRTHRSGLRRARKRGDQGEGRRHGSFVLAETFKNFYLLFAPPETLDPGKVVLNTEAHPISPTWRDR